MFFGSAVQSPSRRRIRREAVRGNPSVGAADKDVLRLAYEQARVLLTEDNDFGELAVRLGLPTHGVVRVDLKALDKIAQAQRLVEALALLGDNARGSLVTIEPSRSRLRKLSQ